MDTLSNPTLEDDIKQVLAEVPAPIRAFFASGKVAVIAKNLIQKNQLNVDQGVIVERELIFLLLGIDTPSEFANVLVEEAQLDQQTIDSIVQDVNDQIFVPLQGEKMKSRTTTMPQPAKPVMQPSREENKTSMSPTPANPQLPPRPPVAFSGGGPLKYFHLENKIPPRPAEVRQQTNIGGPALLQSTQDEKLLEDREEPHIEFNPSSLEATKGAVKIPTRTAPPPQNLPGVFIPPEVPMVQPLSATPKIEPPPAPLKPPVSPLAPVSSRPYSSDPYREPIDENKSV